MEELIRHDWRYIYNSSSSAFEVKPSLEERRILPNSLFKYYSINEKSCNAFFESYIYAPHPDQFNDPFDCYENLTRMRYEEAYKFLRHAYTEREIVRMFKDEKELISCAEINWKVRLYSYTGILSLTECPENLLMWAYYSNHKGYVLEFDYSKFPFKTYGPFQVNYQDKFDPIEFSSNSMLSFLYQTNIKKVAWSHEKEWRLLVEKPDKRSNKGLTLQMEMPGINKLSEVKGVNREFKYNLENLKSITLGHSFFDNYNENENYHGAEIITLRDNINTKKSILDKAISNKIPLFIMVRDESSYTLKRNLIRISPLEMVNTYKMERYERR